MRRQWLLAAALYCLTGLLLTWPLLLHMTAAVPLGSERSPTVPLFNVWTLGWNADRILHGYQGYWDAPIFSPIQNSFAFSEPQPLTGLLAFPLWLINPALAYNGVLLLFLILNGLAAYGLLRHRGLDFLPAFLGGLVMMALPFQLHERGVLQLLPIFGPLLAIDGLWSLTEEPRWQAGLRFGLGLATTFLTSENNALFLSLLLVAMVPFLLPRARTKTFWLALMLAVAIASALVLPVALPQQSALQEMGFRRATTTITRGSAQMADYLRPSGELWASSWFPLDIRGSQRLFPGIVLMLLALVGGFVGLRQQNDRRWTTYLLLILLLAFLVSLGLNLRIGGWRPYELLLQVTPGFKTLRSPFRLAYLVQVILVLLAAVALADFRGRYRILCLLLVGLTLLEFAPRPARLTPLPSPIDTASATGPAVILPFAADRATVAFADTAAWMVATLHQPVPLVNGYSGYFPVFQSQLRTLLADFPTPAGLAALKALGVRTIFIRDTWLDEEQSARLAASVEKGDLLPAAPAADLLVYQLVNAGLSPAQNYDGKWAMRLKLDGEEVELSAYAAVPDQAFYLVAPGVAPLQWQIRIVTPDGQHQSYSVEPPGAVLLYHGSDRWLRVRLPLPDAPGQYRFVLADRASGAILAEESLIVPWGS